MIHTNYFIGSLPHINVSDALQFVRRFSSHLPFLPQLPEANPNEDMIGQMLRGFEIGNWDDQTSCCLKGFLNEFGGVERVKLQFAGPFTVSRSMGVSLSEVESLWRELVGNLLVKWNRLSSWKHLWLQIDEPFWSKETSLPQGYSRFLDEIRSMSAELRIGIHSCASDRPELPSDIIQRCDFFCFDYTAKMMSTSEAVAWKAFLSHANKDLVLGIMRKDSSEPCWQAVSELRSRRPDSLISSACGLYGWTVDEIEAVYGTHTAREQLRL